MTSVGQWQQCVQVVGASCLNSLSEFCLACNCSPDVQWCNPSRYLQTAHIGWSMARVSNIVRERNLALRPIQSGGLEARDHNQGGVASQRIRGTWAPVDMVTGSMRVSES